MTPSRPQSPTPPRIVQWLCGIRGHRDVNTALKDRHAAVCLRCGYVFGTWWKNYPSTNLLAAVRAIVTPDVRFYVNGAHPISAERYDALCDALAEFDKTDGTR